MDTNLIISELISLSVYACLLIGTLSNPYTFGFDDMMRRTVAVVVAAAAGYVIKNRVDTHSRFEVRCGDKANPDMKRIRDKLAKESYQWPWWTLLDSSGNFVTLLGALRSKRAATSKGLIEFNREILTLDCGGCVGLDWHAEPIENPQAIIIIHHGLMGCGKSFYIQSIIPYIKATRPNWMPVVMIARGCGELPLTNSHGFTAARTTDFEKVVGHVKATHPNVPVFAIGFSLGAGIIGNYVGQSGDHSGLSGAMLMSISWNYNTQPYWFFIWSKILVQGLVRWLRTHSHALEHIVDVEQGAAASNIREFDSIVVCQRYDYKKVEDYYHDASAYKTADRISTPTLAMMAADDPVCCVSTINDTINQGYGSGLITAVTGTGGHTSWPLSDTSECESFSDKICVEFIKELLSNLESDK